MSNESTEEEAHDNREFSIDPGVLDRYVGEYRWGEYAIFEVTRDGSRLFGQVLSPALAASIRMQLPALQFLAQRLGAIVAVEYRETAVERHDVFELKREHGSARWRIALAPDGTIANASAVVTGRGIGAGP